MPIIKGQVVDPEGQPVAQAAVYFVSAPVNMADVAQLTDEEGKFTTYLPTPGDYTLGARSDDWGEVQKEIQVIGDDPLTIEMRLNKPAGEK